MKILKNWWIFILTLLASFEINFNWFRAKDFCDINSANCADYLPSPNFSVYPNFTFEKVCGGISGQCIPTHLQIFITDLLIAFTLFFIILCIIWGVNKIFKNTKTNL